MTGGAERHSHGAGHSGKDSQRLSCDLRFEMMFTFVKPPKASGVDVENPKPPGIHVELSSGPGQSCSPRDSSQWSAHKALKYFSPTVAMMATIPSVNTIVLL